MDLDLDLDGIGVMDFGGRKMTRPFRDYTWKIIGGMTVSVDDSVMLAVGAIQSGARDTTLSQSPRTIFLC